MQYLQYKNVKERFKLVLSYWNSEPSFSNADTVFRWKLFLTTIFLNARNPILPPQNTSSTNYLIILPLRIILSTWGIVLSVANHSYRMTNQSSCVANHFSYMTNHFSVVTNHFSHITNHFSPVTNLFCHRKNDFSPCQIIFTHDEPFSRVRNHFSHVRESFFPRDE